MPQSLRSVPLSLALWLAMATTLFAAEIEGRSAIDAVVVYPDGATVTRVIRVDLPAGDTTVLARDFPTTLDPASLRVEGVGTGRLVIGSIDARLPPPQPPTARPEIEKKIEALRDERAVLDDKIAAQTARRQFAERFARTVPLGLGEVADARPLADWRAAWAMVADEFAAVDALIREAKLRQRDIDRELARLNDELKTNPPLKMEVRIDLAADAPGQATLRVSYSVRGARWVPLYDARLDSGAKDRKASLELVRRAEIVQQTGEDWTDVALSVSTVRTGKGGTAPDLRPLIVRFREPLRAAAPKIPDRVGRLDENASKNLPLALAPVPPASAPAAEREAEIESGGYQAVFRIPGRVTIATGEGAKNLRIATIKVEPELLVRSAPALDETAFIEASFKQTEDAPLLAGRVAIYRDGIFVGRGQMTLTPKDETVRLGFGADEKVKVTRVVVRKTEGSSGIITTSKTDEREYKITVRNGHDTPIRIVVEDQIPVSEITDVQVEMLPVTTPPTQRDVLDRRGVLAWSIDAAPGEMREIRLGWRVRWPSGRDIDYTPRQP